MITGRVVVIGGSGNHRAGPGQAARGQQVTDGSRADDGRQVGGGGAARPQISNAYSAGSTSLVRSQYSSSVNGQFWAT